jgi:hypothetical protein
MPNPCPIHTNLQNQARNTPANGSTPKRPKFSDFGRNQPILPKLGLNDCIWTEELHLELVKSIQGVEGWNLDEQHEKMRACAWEQLIMVPGFTGSSGKLWEVDWK